MTRLPSPNLREHIALALTQATVKQCRGVMARPDGSRCAAGLIAEVVFGFTFTERFAMAMGRYWSLEPEALFRFKEFISQDLYTNVVFANDHMNRSFDDIAKLVKGWPETRVLANLAPELWLITGKPSF